MTTSPVMLAVVDSDPIELSHDAVVSAAQSAQPGTRSNGMVEIEGGWFDPLALVSRAAGVEARRLSFRSTLKALHRLGFEIADFDLAAEATRSDASPITEDLDFVLTPQVMTRLQRYRGEWVALSGEMIIEHSDTLRALMELLGERTAAVLKVPTDDPL